MASPNIVTALALDEPQTLRAMTAKAKPAPRFLLDRYFPCNPDTDIFPTETILVDYKDKSGKKLAPLVHAGHKTSARTGFYTDRLTPARIAPTRKLTIADLLTRGFGEQLFSGNAPSQRAVNITMTDVRELMDEVRRRKEFMAADLLQHNRYVLTYEKSDANGADENSGDVTVSFIDATDGNECAYTTAGFWNEAGANIYGDIKAMCRQLEDNGVDAVDLILGSNAADAFLHDELIHKLLDNRRIEMGSIAPTIKAQGATLIGLLNVDGYMINIIEYRESYTSKDGKLTPFIDPDTAIVTAPNAGRSMYAAVTQMEQSDGAFHTCFDKIVPKYISKPEDDIQQIMMTSRPLLAPVIKGGWISGKVTGTTPTEAKQ